MDLPSSSNGRQRSALVGFAYLKSDGMRRPVSRRDAIRSQVIDALEAQEIKETGNEKE
jgi:hypothetical protein